MTNMDERHNSKELDGEDKTKLGKAIHKNETKYFKKIMSAVPYKACQHDAALCWWLPVCIVLSSCSAIAIGLGTSVVIVNKNKTNNNHFC